MRIVDANVLLYAVNQDAPQHVASVGWLDLALGGADSVGLSWIALLAFTRLATKPGLFPRPLTTDEAMTQVVSWCGAPGAVTIHPKASHATTLRQILNDAGAAGNLVNDGHLAALAVEQHGDIVSYDSDFLRFSAIRCYTPEQLLD